MPVEWIKALIGGLLIGLSVTVMLLFNGRVTGISGIVYGIFNPVKGHYAWRYFFIGGLFFGGVIMSVFKSDSFQNNFSPSPIQMVIAGLLVGVGTVLGSGCTSGHGVCGISRLSPRSMVATIIFMATGIAVVYGLRQLGIIL
jgi:uncharacterized membrane protein YedE/YeeE